jgi:hypothetical protein
VQQHAGTQLVSAKKQQIKLHSVLVVFAKHKQTGCGGCKKTEKHEGFAIPPVYQFEQVISAIHQES